MAKRRRNLEGSTFQRPNGSWRAQIQLNGKRLSYGAKTERECLDWIHQIRSEINKGLTFNIATLTLDELFDRWLVYKKGRVSEKVHNQHCQIARDYIRPYIGKEKVREISTIQLIYFYNQEFKTRHGKIAGYRTRKIIHSVIHQVFKDAVIWGIVQRNPAYGIAPRKPPQDEMLILSPTQANQFLTTAKILDHKMYAFFMVTINTGMRLSELRALKWTDLDTDNKFIKISRQIVRKAGGGFNYKAPKTKAGLRSIELGAKTIEALEVQKNKQSTQIITAQEMWNDHGLMFTSTFGNPYQENHIRTEFYKTLEYAGLPKIRFHNLRHTAASIMLNNGVPPIVVSKRLGHSSVTITLDTYGHLIPEMQSGIGDMLDELISPVEVTNAPKCTKLHQKKIQ